MEKKNEIIENFKTALKSTVKSISNKDDVEITFGGQIATSDSNTIKLPEIDQQKNEINFSKARAYADSESLKLKFSDNKIYKNYEPEGTKAKKLYEIAEKIRYETLGTKEYKGIKNNLLNFYAQKNPDQSKQNQIYEAFESYLIKEFFKVKDSKKNINSFSTDLVGRIVTYKAITGEISYC